jgi:predicted RecB family endonuclease
LKSINKAGGDVGKKLGEAFRIVKETASAMFQPFKDAIGTLVKLMGNGKGTGKTMGNIADKIKDIAQKISDFVNKYIVPAIKAAINIAMDIISSVVNFVKAVIAAFKGKWGDMAKYLVKAIAFAVKAIINLFFKTNEVVLSIFFELGNKILDFFASILAGILKGVKKLAGYIGLGSLIPDSWIDALNDVKKPLEGIKNTAIGVMEGVRKTAVNAIDSLANIKSIQIEPGAGDDLIDFGKEKGRELAEVITDPIGESLDNLGGEMGNLVKDIKQKFVDKLLDSVHSKLSEAVDQLTNALEKQKDSALEVFNTQIYALEQLEKAEESLTREQAYQTDRRRMIQERELQILNYQRNRALAIYEGRIDDARMLTLQEQSDNNSYNENIQKLDTDRRKELAQENLNALKDSIQKAQEEASKFYDKQIEDFRNAAAEITKFPPLTIEEYRSQLGQLNDAAKEIAGENGDVLKQMMTDMKDKLRMPNDNVGIFTTGIDSLVSVAKDKYGLLDNTDQNTIIGATIGMIAGISGQFEGSRESIASAFSGIVSDVFDVSTGFTNIATDIVTPTLDAIEQIFITHNPFDVFEQAIRDANTTIVREMYATVGTIGSLVDVLSTRVDQSIVRLAVLNAIASQTSTSAGGSSTDGEAYVTAHTSGGAYYQMGVTSGRLYSVGPGGARVQVRGSIDREILDQLTSMRESITSSQYTQPAFFGGRIAKFANGGFAVPGFPSQGVPALLHGGEYVINANAVRNIGYRTLESLNNMRFNTPSGSSPQVTSSSSTNTTNIYVENFIGQDEWFNNMIKQYNMNVLPKNQKNAGMESRVLTSYNGMTRGA